MSGNHALCTVPFIMSNAPLSQLVNALIRNNDNDNNNNNNNNNNTDNDNNNNNNNNNNLYGGSSRHNEWFTQ